MWTAQISIHAYYDKNSVQSPDAFKNNLKITGQEEVPCIEVKNVSYMGNKAVTDMRSQNLPEVLSPVTVLCNYCKVISLCISLLSTSHKIFSKQCSLSMYTLPLLIFTYLHFIFGLLTFTLIAYRLKYYEEVGTVLSLVSLQHA